MQQRTDATGAVPERDAEVDPHWPDGSEEDRDSTGSIGRCYRCDGSQVYVMDEDGRDPTVAACTAKTMRSLSPDAQTSDWRVHLSARFEAPR